MMSLKRYLTEAKLAAIQPVTGNTIDINVNGITNIKATVLEHTTGSIVIDLNNAAIKTLKEAGIAFDDEEDEVEYMPAVDDVVRIDHPSEHDGHLGQVVEVAPSGSFAYVEFKDGSVESYHSSDLMKVSDEEAYAYFDDEGEEDDDFEESLGAVKRLSGMKEAETPAYDTGPGSPYDRGKSDAYYGRRGNPTKVVDKPNATVQGERMIVQLTDPEEIKQYYAGYEGSEFGEKDYGDFPDTSDYDDDVDEAAMNDVRKLAGIKKEDFTGYVSHTAPTKQLDPNRSKNVIVTSPSGKVFTFDSEEDARRLFLDKWHVVKNPNSGWSVDMSNTMENKTIDEAPAQMGSYLGVKALKAPPLKNYRPAMWENMLGTVYAMNDAGEVKYFDYDHDAAKAYAGIGPDSAPRLYRVDRKAYGKPHGEYRYGGNDDYASPRHGKLVLWVKKNAAPAASPEAPVKETSEKMLNKMKDNDLFKARRDAKAQAAKEKEKTNESSLNVFVKESSSGLKRVVLPSDIKKVENNWSCKVWTKK